MPTVITHETLLQRALVFLRDEREEKPDCSLSALLDEAGERFNLSPMDTAALEHLFYHRAETPSASDDI